MATRNVTLKEGEDIIYPQINSASVPVGGIDTNLIADGAVTDAKMADNKVNVQSVILDGQTVTLCSLIQQLGANNIHYGRWCCTYDGGSSGVTDKPTGNTNASFVCEAYAVRHYTNNDYRYRVVCWVKEDERAWLSEVTPSTSSLVWKVESPQVDELFLGGASGDVTLTGDITQYNYVEIYGYESGQRAIYTKIINPQVNKKFVWGALFYASGYGTAYYRSCVYTISATNKLTQSDASTIEFKTSGITINTSGSSTYVSKVLGYKW